MTVPDITAAQTIPACATFAALSGPSGESQMFAHSHGNRKPGARFACPVELENRFGGRQEPNPPPISDARMTLHCRALVPPHSWPSNCLSESGCLLMLAKNVRTDAQP